MGLVDTRIDYQNPIRVFRGTESLIREVEAWLRDEIGADRHRSGRSYTGDGRWMLIAWFAHPSDRALAALVLL